MKYFIGTEFIEGKQDKTFLGVKYGETKPTIDLISIGIVSEEYTEDYAENICNNGVDTVYIPKKRTKQIEYYAISKDFNLKAAWKNEWVRENVLKQIYSELVVKANDRIKQLSLTMEFLTNEFNYKGLKILLDLYGKTNKQIAQEIKEFVGMVCFKINGEIKYKFPYPTSTEKLPEFYGYYSDYDWVVLNQLFGGKGYLPKSFPMYCKDLKQTLDEKVQQQIILNSIENKEVYSKFDFELSNIKSLPNYPKQTNEHNALADAKWNYELYKFLNIL